MKRLLIGSLSLMIAINSCIYKSSCDCCDPVLNEVRLRADVESVSSKATGPIDGNFKFNFSIGVYAKNGNWQAGSKANFINNDAATVLGTAGHRVLFAAGPYYFPSDGTTVNFYGYTPYGVELKPAEVGASPVVQLSVDGHDDVMWASVSGSNNTFDPTIDFAHKLTQLQFTFKASDGNPASGNRVVSLKVINQPSLINMTVESGFCTYEGNIDIQALSALNQTAGIEITSEGTNAKSPLLTIPLSGSAAYLLDIVVKPISGPNITYSAVPVDVKALAGRAQMITIHFSSTGISTKATVSDWIVGNSGAAIAI